MMVGLNFYQYIAYKVTSDLYRRYWKVCMYKEIKPNLMRKKSFI